jgi:recombination protein RecA
MGVDLGLIQKSGAWYSMGSERIGQGRDNSRIYLEEHADMMAGLEAKVLAHHGIGPAVDGVAPANGSVASSSTSSGGAASGGAASGGDDDASPGRGKAASSRPQPANGGSKPVGAGSAKRGGARPN